MPEGTSKRSQTSNVSGGPHKGELTTITIVVDTNIYQFEIEKSQKQFQALVGPGSKWME